MPVPTLDQVKKKESSLKKSFAEKGDSMEPAKRRHARKQIKRAQRKRRLMVAEAARVAPKPKETAEPAAVEAKPAGDAADAQETKSE